MKQLLVIGFLPQRLAFGLFVAAFQLFAHASRS